MTYTVYGTAGSGSVPVEAALTLIGAPFERVKAVTWEGDAERDKVAPVNPMRQIPALVTPDGETITFIDALQGPQTFVAGRDFGDFLVWRKDGFPAYELAVVADDHAMGITEVVRGSDLLLSTVRQLLLHRALGWMPPAWAHAPLIVDGDGKRLAKRTAGLSIRELRQKGKTPEEVLTAPVSQLLS